MKKLNTEEIVLGALFGLSFWPFLGLMAMVIAVPCGFLWALSGAGYSKLFRRLGVPAVAYLGLFVAYPSSWLILIGSVFLAFDVLCIGYGLPSNNPPDTGSALGRFFWNLSGASELPAGILTRMAIALLLWISFCPLFWVNKFCYFVFGGFLVLGMGSAYLMMEII